MFFSGPMGSPRFSTLLATLVVVIASSVASAKSPTHFARTQVVQGSTLTLNGAGTRVRTGVKVYDLALYTEHKVGTADALIALPGAKRLNFVARREVSGTDLGLTFIKGLTANAPPELVQKNAASSKRMIDIFSARSLLAAGDHFAMEYVPGQGTTFYMAGQPQGAPVGGPEFFELVLKIWVGPAPGDAKLRDALLGH